MLGNPTKVLGLPYMLLHCKWSARDNSPPLDNFSLSCVIILQIEILNISLMLFILNIQ